MTRRIASGIGQLRDVCCKSDQDFDISGFAPQSAYTPVVQEMKTAGSNYGQATQGSQTILLRKEATLQGLTDVKVWDCTTGCYSKSFLSDGGSDVDGQFVDTLYLPFLSKAEQNANPMLKNFVKYTGADKADGFGVYAWSAMIAFRDAVNNVVKADGVNGVTRKAIFAGAEQDQRLQRRRHVRHHRPGRPQDLAVPRAHAGDQGRLQAGLPDQGRDVRLREEERGTSQTRRVLTERIRSPAPPHQWWRRAFVP